VAGTTGTTTKKGWKTDFLAGLEEYGNVSRAADAAGIWRSTAYDEREKSPRFAADWDRALDLGTSALEDEARRRAFEGVEKPIYQGGSLVGQVQEYSDTLLIFLLKAHRPKYRDTSRNVTINITPEQAAKLSDAEIDALLQKEGLL
jgi:hypothetical protein